MAAPHRRGRFINAAAEFPDIADPIHAIAAEHKRLIVGYLAGLAREAGATEPETLALDLSFLLDGATVCAQISHDADAADHARDAARVLIEDAL